MGKYSHDLSHYHTGVWITMPHFRVMKNETSQVSIESNTKVPPLTTPFFIS